MTPPQDATARSVAASGHPRQEPAVTSAVRILDAYPELALHPPGSEARVLVELSADVATTVDLRVRLLDRLEPLAQAREIVTLDAGTRVVPVVLSTPPDDARGYTVAVTVRWPGGEAKATTALLVASHWKLAPRYGFVARFEPSEAGQAPREGGRAPGEGGQQPNDGGQQPNEPGQQLSEAAQERGPDTQPDTQPDTHNTADTRADAVVATDPVAYLARFHITAVQFYDWMYRHYLFLPPPEAVTGAGETFVDGMDRRVSLAAVRDKIAACHGRGMAAIAYGAVYGPEPEFILQHPDWLLYDSAGNSLDLIKRFYITDLRPGGWRDRILGEFESAVSELGFDGIHMDQYGFPKLAYDHLGEPVDLAAEFPGLIDEAAARIAKRREGAMVIFNSVNDWPTELIARSDQAAIYIEVWSPNDRYRDLVSLIRRARELSGKHAVLAAYLRPFHQPGTAAEWSLRYATAIINAAGGHHLILGEGDHVLREPYYPDHGRLSAAGRAVVRRYFDHTAAATDYLHAFDLRPVERVYATGINTAVTLKGADAQVVPTAGSVWLTVTQRPGQLVINLVNLTALEDELWDAPRSAPTQLDNLSIELEPIVKNVRATWASPDAPDTVQASALEAQVAADGRVTLRLPTLELWGTLVLDHA